MPKQDRTRELKSIYKRVAEKRGLEKTTLSDREAKEVLATIEQAIDDVMKGQEPYKPS